MKLTWKQVEPFVKNPDKAARVILVYGPDSGLVKERVKAIGTTIVADLNDPFNACTLSADQLQEDPSRLFDEAMALSMMGGARLILITEAGDKITPVIKEYLESPSAENLVLLAAAELGPKSPLRQLCEKAKNAAALPCYVEDERGIAQVIRDTLKDAGFTIQADALALMAASVAGDRLRVRSEIEKLMTYRGTPPASITVDDVAAICADAGAQTLDDLVYAVAGGRVEPAVRALSRLQEEGTAAITILRVLQGHFRKLHAVKAMVVSGTPVEEALKSLQPPLFFKLEQPFRTQVSRWSLDGLMKVLERLSHLEAQSKQTATPVDTLLAQALLSLSASSPAKAA